MKRPSLSTLLTLVAVLALLAGATVYFVIRARDTGTSAPAAAGGERKILYWTDPMTPGYRSDKPGKSPFMDMELVPVYEEPVAGTTTGMPVVTIEPQVLNNLGVRTYTLTRASRPRTLTTHGYLFRAGGGALRAQVDILDREAGWVRPGLTAEVRVTAVPGRTWPGVVDSLQPDIDIGARSLKARVRLTVNDPALQPNMFAEVTILSPPPPKQLAIPREALIRTGTRTAVVVALGAGRFQPADVIVGSEFGDWVEIRSGLKEGDNVVVSGQFLIDSESSLRASFSRIGGAAGSETKPGAPGTGGTP
jgi:membrane fusion protein, copper/silver efflux system